MRRRYVGARIIAWAALASLFVSGATVSVSSDAYAQGRKKPGTTKPKPAKPAAPSNDIELDEPHQVRLRWGCDARYIAIEVSDRFGSLDRDTVLAALAKKDVRDSGGGAGMGVALTYRSCDHLVFNLAPGKRTEIIALIDVRQPTAERVPASSYNVFVERSP